MMAGSDLIPSMRDNIYCAPEPTMKQVPLKFLWMDMGGNFPIKQSKLLHQPATRDCHRISVNMSKTLGKMVRAREQNHCGVMRCALRYTDTDGQ